MSQGSEVKYSPFIFGYGTYSSGAFCKIPLSFGPSLSVGRGINRAVLGGAGIGVSAYSENRDAALEFAEFVMSSEVMPGVVGAHRGQGGLLSGWGVSDEPEMNKFFFSSTHESMEAGIVRPRFAGFVKFLGELGDRLNYWVDRGMHQEDVAAEISTLFSSHCEENPDLEAVFLKNGAHFTPEAYTGVTPHKFPTNNPLSGESEEAAQK
jgi:multiple sugar transport system substrate-binding protein